MEASNHFVVRWGHGSLHSSYIFGGSSMKRSLIVLCVAALLATLPLASVAEAGRHGRRGRPGWPNRTTRRGSYRRANPANRGLRGWQGWRGYRGWRDCQDTQPEEVMVEIWHVIAYFPEDGGIAFGELMEVPESEVEAHLVDHGDITVGDGTVLHNLDGLLDLFDGFYDEIDLSNAQVYFYL